MIDQILQQQGGFYGTDQTKKNDALGKDAFLKLLVTQLQHQDPLNPLDDKEFIAQLAQFSSLEQMTNVADGIKALTEKTAQQDMLSAVNYIGKNVTASGSTMTKIGNATTPVFFTLSDTAATVYANVYDDNNNLIRTEKFTSMQAGEFQFTWDGTDYNGQMVPNGQYHVYFGAESPTGSAVFVDTEVSGTITGLEQSNGATYFQLADGRKINFNDIRKVVQPMVSDQD
ncbi:MAG: flagellar hook assembly protein FlgD [Desulfomicrobium sp.]|nr:flagellar hook assembly protein FlgD [Desulfomicrobium sp.]NLV95972.1 flagellar hook assembly protein FlgD [Desulfovibrionales bacterium]